MSAFVSASLFVYLQNHEKYLCPFVAVLQVQMSSAFIRLEWDNSFFAASKPKLPAVIDFPMELYTIPPVICKRNRDKMTALTDKSTWKIRPIHAYSVYLSGFAFFLSVTFHISETLFRFSIKIRTNLLGISDTNTFFLFFLFFFSVILSVSFFSSAAFSCKAVFLSVFLWGFGLVLRLHFACDFLLLWLFWQKKTRC